MFANSVRVVIFSWACCLPLCTFAQEEKQLGSVEVGEISVGRFQRLAINVEEGAPRGFLQMMKAPEGTSFVVIWTDLKVTPGKDEDGDAMTVIPAGKIQLLGEDGEEMTQVGQCTRDGRFSSSYNYGFTLYGTPEKETVPHSLVYAVKDGLAKFKLKFGGVEKTVEAPSQAEPTLDRGAAAIFKVAKVEVVEGFTNKERLGPYGKPAGDAEIKVEGTTSRFLVMQLYIKGKVSNSREGGFRLRSGELGLLYGAEVFVTPLGSIGSDDFQPGETYLSSEQDVIGDFSTSAVKLVFPLPGRVTKFKLLYLMQPIAELDVPK